MTPEEFRAWRKRMGFSRHQVAKLFGFSFEWVRSVEMGRLEIRPVVEIACRQLEVEMEMGKNERLG